jgi:hypothetical protein
MGVWFDNLSWLKVFSRLKKLSGAGGGGALQRCALARGDEGERNVRGENVRYEFAFDLCEDSYR